MSDPSEMQIATHTVLRQADVSYNWVKQLWEETRQCSAIVEITDSVLRRIRHLTV